MKLSARGGIILSRVVNDKQALSRQIMLYRDFIRAIFLGLMTRESLLALSGHHDSARLRPLLNQSRHHQLDSTTG
jgi:hypothetical protein